MISLGHVFANKLKTIVSISVYREEGKIGNVLSSMNGSTIDEICLVVDEPTLEIRDEIEKAAKKVQPKIHLIIHNRRMGVGHAIRDGICYALDRGYDVIVIMAGNGKDDPMEIPRLLAPIRKWGYDYVQGSRFLPRGRSVRNPLLRGIFSRLYPYLWTLLTHKHCTDVTNGFRAYKTSIFEDPRINIWQDWLDGYALEYYLHWKILKLDYKMREVPVSKVYSHRNRGGYSKIQPLKDWWGILGPLVYLAFGLRS